MSQLDFPATSEAELMAVAGGSGFTIFLLILSFLLSSFLLITPIVYDR